MMFHPPTRGLWIALSAAVSGVLMAGCSGEATLNDDAAGASGSGEGAVGQAEEGAFPVTIEHAYGSTEITEEPERVVTMGWSAEDVVAALGVVPIAIQSDTYGGDEDGYHPWFVDQVEELGGELPAFVKFGDDFSIDYEQLVVLDPDVILVPHGGLSEKEYKRLSEIAPTVAQLDAAWATPWVDTVAAVGQALGQPERAQELTDETLTLVADRGAENPAYAETTFVYGWSMLEGESSAGVYSAQDARVTLIEQLGLQLSPGIAVLDEKKPNDFFHYVSLEELDTVDADFYLGWSDNKAATDRMLDNPLVQKWRPFAEDEYVLMEDRQLGMATSAPNPLSIPWSLDTLTDLIDEAIAD